MHPPIAIIGGLGYLGSQLSAYFYDHSLDFWVVDRQSKTEPSQFIYPYRSSIPDLAMAISGAKSVVHLATITTPATSYHNHRLELDNIALTLDIIDACTAEGVEHLIYASSGGTVYGDTQGQPAREAVPPNPICSYGIGKLACEYYLKTAAEQGGARTTVLRISNAYGGGQRVKGDQGVISYLIRQLKESKAIHLLGNTVRDYVHINDIIQAFYKALTPADAAYRVFNISTGVGISLVELLKLLADLLNVEPRYEVAEPRPFDLTYNVLDNSRAREELGWEPQIPLEEGLRLAVEGFRQQF